MKSRHGAFVNVERFGILEKTPTGREAVNYS
jgi:hypothetical protein